MTIGDIGQMANHPGRTRILIADDDPLALRLLQLILEHSEYAVFTARDGAQALARITEVKPAAVIVDMLMPHMTGIEFAPRARQEAGGAPLAIVLVTAMDTEQSRAAARGAGIDAFISKPFQRPELLRTLAELLGSDAPVAA